MSRPNPLSKETMSKELIIKDFKSIRILKWNLVYISGLPLGIADKNILETFPFLLQYG